MSGASAVVQTTCTLPSPRRTATCVAVTPTPAPLLPVSTVRLHDTHCHNHDDSDSSTTAGMTLEVEIQTTILPRTHAVHDVLRSGCYNVPSTAFALLKSSRDRGALLSQSCVPRPCRDLGARAERTRTSMTSTHTIRQYGTATRRVRSQHISCRGEYRLSVRHLPAL